MERFLITDLDNTLYNWVDYFGPSFRGMVHALSREMRLSEDMLYAQFRDVYSRAGSLEYAYSVQELAACKNLRPEEVKRYVEIARGAFRRIRGKHLQPYEGVNATLKWAQSRSVRIVGLSNAPLFQVQRRLAVLGLDKYFHGLAAWKGNEMPDNPFFSNIDEKVRNAGYLSRLDKSWAFESHELKPNSAGYERVIQDLRAVPENVYVVGDSLAKDVIPAMQIGAIGVWARYGQVFARKNYETVLRITPWREEDQRVAYGQAEIKPDHVLDSFSELMGIVKPSQLALFE